jgi:chemotaxis protein methyltransferase WspC
VRGRLRACHLDDATAYLQLLRTDEIERQELIEAVVVPETWFFRNGEAFAALTRLVQRREQPLRLLSLPCSTGEEPYSMAMALLDAGMAPERFRIEAVDVSARALASARRARYGTNSFRGADLGFRERHFQEQPEGHQLSERVRHLVHFHRGNMFDAAFLRSDEVYDVIFCRNVLIYFDGPSQQRAVALLRRLLHPDGVLFVGPSETGLLLEHDFVPIRMPLAFAFHHPSASVAATPQWRPTALPSTTAKRPWPAAARRSVPSRPAAAATVATATATAPVALTELPPHIASDSDLVVAAHLADQGRLDEAARLCERHLRTAPASTQALYLLGLIRDTGGDTDAATTLYRKALYLDPGHEAALAHLAFALERRGDADAALALRQRLARRQEARQ